MGFDAATNASEKDFHDFVNALISHAVSRLKAGNPHRSVIESYLRTAYDAHLSPEEATDFFCVDARNVVESWEASEPERERLVALFDEINTDEVRRRVKRRT